VLSAALPAGAQLSRFADGGATLMEPEEIDPTHFSLVGLAVERNRPGADFELFEDTLAGLYIGHRWGWFDFALKLMVSSNYASNSIREWRTLGSLSLRAAFELLGLSWTYGVGTQFEIRLDDHYWLLFAVPAELGLVIWNEGSWHIQLLTGPRILVAGELVDNFIIDPTGINNAEAEANLSDEKSQRFDLFLGVAFTRVID
jgi:hypothetical protein